MEYRPFWMTISPFFQVLAYGTAEVMFKLGNRFEFDREHVTTADDGTLGIDWTVDKDGGRPDPIKNKRPILLLAPGLGGGASNLYTLELMAKAVSKGYKVGTLLYRGSEGVPITSA